MGAGAARLAHRVLGHVREAPRARVRDPRRRARSRLPAPRERDRAVACARPSRSRSSGCTTGCSTFAGEEMHKSVGNDVSLKAALDTLGPRDAARLLHDRALAQAARVLGRDAGGGGGARRGVPRGVPRPERAGAGRRVGAVRGRARRRLQHAGGPRGPARVARPRAPAARARRSSGSSRSPSPTTTRRAEIVALAVQRIEARASARLRRGRSPARRDRGRRLGRSRRGRRRSASFAADDADTRVRLRAERRARALPRPAAGPRDVGHGACRRRRSRGSMPARARR